MIGLALALLAAQDTRIEAPPGWEVSGSQAPPSSACRMLDAAHVWPVPQAHRAAAIERLANTGAVPLSEQEAATLIGVPLKAGEPLATTVIRARGDRLREQKRRVFEERVGGWSNMSEEELGKLESEILEERHRGLKPYLVRAIAKWEGNGALSACASPDALFMFHGSLGRSTPVSIAYPAIVFLEKTPARVYADWAMAE